MRTTGALRAAEVLIARYAGGLVERRGGCEDGGDGGAGDPADAAVARAPPACHDARRRRGAEAEGASGWRRCASRAGSTTRPTSRGRS